MTTRIRAHVFDLFLRRARGLWGDTATPVAVRGRVIYHMVTGADRTRGRFHGPGGVGVAPPRGRGGPMAIRGWFLDPCCRGLEPCCHGILEILNSTLTSV